jgi:heme/copper-type cytochrome/quinol oxidase subunit 3
VQLMDVAGLGLDWRAHAYSSIVIILAGLMTLLMASSLIMLALLWWWSGREGYWPKHRVAVENGAAYWYSTVAAWLVLVATLYGAPYLI